MPSARPRRHGRATALSRNATEHLRVRRSAFSAHRDGEIIRQCLGHCRTLQQRERFGKKRGRLLESIHYVNAAALPRERSAESFRIFEATVQLDRSLLRRQRLRRRRFSERPSPRQASLVRHGRLRFDARDRGLEPLPALARQATTPPTALPRRRQAQCRSPGRRRRRAPSRAQRERCRARADRWRASPHRACAASRRTRARIGRGSTAHADVGCASISPASASFSSA